MFINLADKIADSVIKNNIVDIAKVLDIGLTDSGQTLKDYITETSIKVGEKINIKNLFLLQGDVVVKYIHSNYRIAVLISVKGNISNEGINAIKEVAMQVASMNPIALRREDIAKDIVEKELEVAKEQARNEGKAEAHLDKIAQGRLNKFYKENVLLEQDFVKDSSKSIEKYLSEFPGLSIEKYTRSQIK